MKETKNTSRSETPDLRGINNVMDKHTKEWLATPGVVGCYVTQRDNGEPYIVIMTSKDTADIRKTIPEKVEGYPVEIEESGEIKPLKN
ncbi:MAG: hypothetical protein ACHQQQ_00840 [Bacteroidota bacterium]